MERIHKVAKTLRNNWKKSAFGACVICYGAATAVERYQIRLLMQAACKEALKYGDSSIDIDRNPRLITVILNPVANKRSAKKEYEKYCEPLLQLAGLQVDLVLTASEGNAKEIVENLKGTEAIVVAGGDGTLAETVTGLLRRSDDANQFPIGILPLGRNNSTGNNIFPNGKGQKKVQQLIDASMAIIKADVEWRDAMKIEPIVEDNEIAPKPTYALTSIEWGAFREVASKKDKYWFIGSLRDYATYVFNGYKDSITWNCMGTLKYSPPCKGCSNCIQKKQELKRNWSFFVPVTQTAAEIDFSKVVNETCTQVQELCFKTCEISLSPSCIEKPPDYIPSIKIGLGKNYYSYTEFVAEGWRRIKGEKPSFSNVIHARMVEILPKNAKETEQIYIDNEEFEVKPIKITIIPKAVKLFCLQK